MGDGSGQSTTSHGSPSTGSSHASSRGSSRGGGGSGGTGGAGRQSPISPMASVAFITLAALFGVGVLAIQANGSAPKVSNNSQSQSQPGTSLSPPGTAQ